MRNYSPSRSDETRHRTILGYPPSPSPVQSYNLSPAEPQFSHPGYQNQPTNKSFSFGCMMLILLIVLITVMCLVSLIMFLVFGTRMPEFKAESLKVSNFSVANTSVWGLWEAEVTVKNADKKLSIKFDRLRLLILYKGIVLGTSTFQTVEVKNKQTMNLNFSVLSDASQNIDYDMQGWSLPPLVSDWKDGNGVMYFSVRLLMNANFSSSAMVYKNDNMRVFCDDMSLRFSSKSEGASRQGSVSRCEIR